MDTIDAKLLYDLATEEANKERNDKLMYRALSIQLQNKIKELESRINELEAENE